ncbi:hypothetical protein KHU50_004229 [Colletotrichum sp. SAR 10_65]|nr:hypothetical protein K4K51_008208 [Colletotrichum sp. SAR 10_75]KAI8175397.1 hypothetical protein KHU50_004229 [Colletotrichum sp. SAR 10_65]KAI8220010.1 hypothetical protein K4K53_007930 [Colletotrichum sp. SAR 10_77]
MKSTLIAVALAQTAIVLAGVYKGYTCVMSNGQINPSNNLCNDAYGTPLPGQNGIPQYKTRYDKGCADNQGKVNQVADC